MATKQTATSTVKVWDFTLTLSGGIIGEWCEWTFTLDFSHGHSKTYNTDEMAIYDESDLETTLWDEAMRIVEKYGRVISTEITNVEVCPDCLQLITDDNPLIDETRYSVEFGACVGCCDPTP